MNQKLWTKVLASLLVMTLTFTNFILLGIYASNIYATSDNLENQQTVTNNENVTFDAYFKDEAGNLTHTVRENIDREDLKLYVSVGVKKGYLKNAQIQISGENQTDSNLKMKNSNENLEYIETIDEDTNKIYLKQINGGTQVALEIPVTASNEDRYDLSNFSKLNDIRLTGSYVGDDGKEIEINKTIQTRNEWTEVANAVLEQQVLRFIPYQVGQKEGTILQTLVRNGIENNVLPIEETKIRITVPTVNGKNPTSANVIANGTLGTNGKNVESFGTDNWTYDVNTGTIIITVKNEANNNQVSWLKEEKDEFIVTYIYDEKVDTLSTAENVTSEIKVYNSVETKVSANSELNISQNEVLGQIVTGTITATNSISKGYLYTKAEKDTTYEEKINVDISYPELVDELKITQDMDYFVNEAGEISPTTISNTNYAYYKATRISKANFEKILGEEGTLTITTLAGEKLVTFHKDTATDENGDYVFEFEKEVNQIVIETSKPVATGKLEIRHEKMLKGNTDYSRTQVESFKGLKVVANVQAKAEDTVISSVDTTNEITLVAPSTKIEAAVNNSNLSTVVTNKDVELRVVLKTNDITCDLYKNPVVEIVLPNYIQELAIKDINLLFDNELTIKEKKTYTNENGNIVIQILLEGEQTVYSQNEISKGANIVINTDITLKKLTPTKEEVMKVYVTNENVTTYENTEPTKARTASTAGYVETTLKAVAPTGVVTTNSISGYNQAGETVTSISGESQVGKLDARAKEQIATVSMDIINNYNNKINNITILGRIPKEGNKDITGEDLGSNIDTTLQTIISINTEANYYLYYSENPVATKDIADENNGWKNYNAFDDLSKVKSYLVVLNNYEMNTGEKISLEYDIRIPGDLEYNKSVYTNYAVYFNNVKENETIEDKQVATKIGLSTGQGPNLEVAMKSDRTGDIEEETIITYTISVRNNGEDTLKDVTLVGNIPEGTIYTAFEGEEGTEEGIEQTYDRTKKEYSETFKEIKAGETKTIQYTVQVDSLDKETSKEIQVQGKAKVEGYEAEFTSEIVTNKIVQGYLNVSMSLDSSYGTKKEAQEVTYITTVKNVNAIPKENVIVSNTLPDGVSYVSSNQDGVYNEETNTVTWDLGTLNGKAIKYITLRVKIDELQNGQTRKEIVNTMHITTKEKELTTNEVSFTVTKPVLTITQSTSTSENVVAGDTIEYNVTIKNLGEVEVNNIVIKDYLPEGLKYRGETHIINGKTYESWIGNTDATINISSIGAGESIDISIKALVENTEQNKTERKITNIVELTADDITKIGSNEISHNIVLKNETDDPSTGEIINGTYKITGLVWLDENNNGRRDDEESTLGNIQVMLVDSETGKIVTDSQTGIEKVQNTNAEGLYTFANLNPGKYLVVFYYDSDNYAVTTYRADGVIDSRNSDVISMKVTLNGETKVAGVANSIQIENESMTHIDMGLIVKPKFDLKLDKVISKITVNNASGAKVYEYNDVEVAKVDLKDKEVEGTTIIIEYKIKVTNEGEVAGYAKKVVDYMPQDMKFSSELNTQWYAGESGNVYNSSLAETLINPGETKEITLILTKQMTQDNLGTINNVAEIYEDSNDFGLEDVDSTTANKVQQEDDISSADAIIGVKTGEVYIYIVITFISITILGLGIYFINKKVLGKIE